MEKKEFKILINASREKVWDSLWSDAGYREWTAAFGEGSHFKTDWKKGSKVLFLGSEDGGMVSTITDNKPNELMAITHLGIIKDGVEDVDSAESKIWQGAFENYQLRSLNGATELTVELGGGDKIPEDLQEYFFIAWPKALDNLKNIAERN